MEHFLTDFVRLLKATHLLELFSGILILLLGWVIASLIAKAIKTLLLKVQLSRKLSVVMPEEDAAVATKIEKAVGKIVFWLIFLLSVACALSLFHIDAAFHPVNELLTRIYAYLPNLLAAGVIVLFASLLAKGVRYGIGLALQYLRLDEMIESKFDTDGKPSEVSSTVGTVFYYFVWLCFLPAIFGTLGLEGLMHPMQLMLERFLTYLPNLFSAAIILVLGIPAAKLIKKFIAVLLDNPTCKNIQVKIGIGEKNIGKPASIIAYILFVIPVFAAAFQALRIEVLSQPVGALLQNILDVAGSLFGAALIVFAFYLLGSFAENWTKKVAAELNIKRFLVIFKKENLEKDGKDVPAEMLGKLVFLGIIFFGVLTAFDVMHFSSAADLLRSFVPFMARILLAFIVFLLGISLSNFLADCVKNHFEGNPLLSRIVRYALMFFSAAFALHCTGISSPIVSIAFSLILGSVAVAAALAFGLGGREVASEKLREWFKK